MTDIEVYTERYEREHSHLPAGKRYWRFTLVAGGGAEKESSFHPEEALMYQVALEKALKVAARIRATKVIVEP